jgi:hypothetical protein
VKVPLHPFGGGDPHLGAMPKRALGEAQKMTGSRGRARFQENDQGIWANGCFTSARNQVHVKASDAEPCFCPFISCFPNCMSQSSTGGSRSAPAGARGI